MPQTMHTHRVEAVPRWRLPSPTDCPLIQRTPRPIRTRFRVPLILRTVSAPTWRVKQEIVIRLAVHILDQEQNRTFVSHNYNDALLSLPP